MNSKRNRGEKMFKRDKGEGKRRGSVESLEAEGW